MSDFENRLRDALGSGADRAPDVHGLADAARSRARARRRTTTGVVAAVAIAAIAVPVGVFALRDSGADRSGGPAVDVSEPSVPDGWRTESWRDLEIEVPDSWGYGALSTWCIGGGPRGSHGAGPVVERPGGAVEDIACTPSSGYGVGFVALAAGNAASDLGHPEQMVGTTPGDQWYPEGSWVGMAGTPGGEGVLVVASTEEIAQQILDSVRKIEDVDSNGCAPRDGATVPPDAVPDDGRVSVCRYDGDGWLVQSERLSEEDSATAMEALVAAPMRAQQEPCGRMEFYDTVVIGTGQDLGSVRVVWGSRCVGLRGVYFSGVVRELTPDVMYWALSPGWSGAVDGDVPMPERLRSR